MDLGATIRSATGTLAQISRQTDVVARNVTRGADPDHVRREAITVSTGAGVRIDVERATVQRSLVSAQHGALAQADGERTRLDALTDLRARLVGPDGTRSLLARTGDLDEALRAWSVDPSNATAARQTVDAAQAVARTVVSNAADLQSTRRDVDRQIAQGAETLSGLLDDLHRHNQAVVEGARLDRPDHDAADRRDATLREIARWLPVSTFTRENDDIVVTTQRGTVLFETRPREVAFEPSATLASGAPGAPLLIDALPLRGGGEGRFEALLTLRDRTLPEMMRDLDEAARGLVTAFAETAPGQPDRPGLFRLAGAATIPGGAWIPNAASMLEVHDGAEANPLTLRDGGLNGPATVTNPQGHPGHADRLNALLDASGTPLALDLAGGLASLSVNGVAQRAIAALDGEVSASDARTVRAEAFRDAVSDRIGNATGTNLDEEMTRLLALERSYEATARVVAVADEMLATLLASVR